MKFKSKKGRLDEPYFEMTPMIDIVFLLIIFFMVVINFQQLNVEADLLLPQTDHAIPPKNERGSRVVMNFTRNDQWVVSGKLLSQKQIEHLLSIESRVAKELPDGTKDVTIVVRAHKTAPYEKIVPIIIACRDAGISKIAFMTLTSREEE